MQASRISTDVGSFVDVGGRRSSRRDASWRVTAMGEPEHGDEKDAVPAMACSVRQWIWKARHSDGQQRIGRVREHETRGGGGGVAVSVERREMVGRRCASGGKEKERGGGTRKLEVSPK